MAKRAKQSPEHGQELARQQLAQDAAERDKAAKSEKKSSFKKPKTESRVESDAADAAANVVPLEALPDADLIRIAEVADPPVPLSNLNDRDQILLELKTAGHTHATFG